MNLNLNATVDVVVDPDVSFVSFVSFIRSIGSGRSSVDDRRSVRAIDRTVKVDVNGGVHVHVHVNVNEI